MLKPSVAATRRLPRLFVSLALVFVLTRPASAQTSGDANRQPSDERMAEIIAGLDYTAGEEFNRHDAYALAARYWDDAIFIRPTGITRGRAAIQRVLEDEFKSLDPKDFAEKIDEIHISGDHGWFVAHWSSTIAVAGNNERRPASGYITAVLERRSGEWKARVYVVTYSRTPPN